MQQVSQALQKKRAREHKVAAVITNANAPLADRLDHQSVRIIKQESSSSDDPNHRNSRFYSQSEPELSNVARSSIYENQFNAYPMSSKLSNIDTDNENHDSIDIDPDLHKALSALLEIRQNTGNESSLFQRSNSFIKHMTESRFCKPKNNFKVTRQNGCHGNTKNSDSKQKIPINTPGFVIQRSASTIHLFIAKVAHRV